MHTPEQLDELERLAKAGRAWPREWRLELVAAARECAALRIEREDARDERDQAYEERDRLREQLRRACELLLVVHGSSGWRYKEQAAAFLREVAHG